MRARPYRFAERCLAERRFLDGALIVGFGFFFGAGVAFGVGVGVVIIDGGRLVSRTTTSMW